MKLYDYLTLIADYLNDYDIPASATRLSVTDATLTFADPIEKMMYVVTGAVGTLDVSVTTVNLLGDVPGVKPGHLESKVTPLPVVIGYANNVVEKVERLQGEMTSPYIPSHHLDNDLTVVVAQYDNYTNGGR